MKCVAKIYGAAGDFGDTIPPELLACAEKWQKLPTETTGAAILQIFNRHLGALFVPSAIGGIEEIFDDPSFLETDISAVQVSSFAFDFEDDGAPIVSALAIFEIPFAPRLSATDVEGWENSEGDSLSWGVAFFWNFGEQQVFLDIDYRDCKFLAERFM